MTDMKSTQETSAGTFGVPGPLPDSPQHEVLEIRDIQHRGHYSQPASARFVQCLHILALKFHLFKPKHTRNILLQYVIFFDNCIHKSPTVFVYDEEFPLAGCQNKCFGRPKPNFTSPCAVCRTTSRMTGCSEWQLGSKSSIG